MEYDEANWGNIQVDTESINMMLSDVITVPTITLMDPVPSLVVPDDIRYRCFTDSESNVDRIGLERDFVVQKKRRMESYPTALPTLVTHDEIILQKQFDLLTKDIDQASSVQQFDSVFAYSRRTGVAPSLACHHRFIRMACTSVIKNNTSYNMMMETAKAFDVVLDQLDDMRLDSIAPRFSTLKLIIELVGSTFGFHVARAALEDYCIHSSSGRQEIGKLWSLLMETLWDVPSFKATGTNPKTALALEKRWFLDVLDTFEKMRSLEIKITFTPLIQRKCCQRLNDHVAQTTSLSHNHHYQHENTAFALQFFVDFLLPGINQQTASSLTEENRSGIEQLINLFFARISSFIRSQSHVVTPSIQQQCRRLTEARDAMKIKLSYEGAVSLLQIYEASMDPRGIPLFLQHVEASTPVSFSVPCFTAFIKIASDHQHRHQEGEQQEADHFLSGVPLGFFITQHYYNKSGQFQSNVNHVELKELWQTILACCCTKLHDLISAAQFFEKIACKEEKLGLDCRPMLMEVFRCCCQGDVHVKASSLFEECQKSTAQKAGMAPCSTKEVWFQSFCETAKKIDEICFRAFFRGTVMIGKNISSDESSENNDGLALSDKNNCRSDFLSNIQKVIKTGLVKNSDGCYVSVMDSSAVVVLASDASSASHFVAMMKRYQQGQGAATILFFESILFIYNSKLSTVQKEKCFQFISTWLKAQSSWFKVLPFSWTLQHSVFQESQTPSSGIHQISGGKQNMKVSGMENAFLVPWLKILKAQHKKVVFFTEEKGTVQLLEDQELKPVVVLSDLMKKLKGLF